MTGEYSPFHLIVWGVFIAAMLLVAAVERVFRSKYPEFPGSVQPTEKR